MDPRGFNNNGFSHHNGYNTFNGGYNFPAPPLNHPPRSPPLRRHFGGARGEHEWLPGPPPPLYHSAAPMGQERQAPYYYNTAALARGQSSQVRAPPPFTFNPAAKEFNPGGKAHDPRQDKITSAWKQRKKENRHEENFMRKTLSPEEFVKWHDSKRGVRGKGLREYEEKRQMARAAKRDAKQAAEAKGKAEGETEEQDTKSDDEE